MSLFLTRSLLSNVCLKRSFVCNISNEIRLCYAQYHTLNNTSKIHKCNDPMQRGVALFSNINSTISLLKDLCKKGANFLPLINVTKCRRIGFSWYESLDEINIEEFFTVFDMPDTFYSRFKIMELHVWMLLCYLPQGNKRDDSIRYSVMMAMWQDHNSRAKLLADFNNNHRKNMKDLYEKFKVSLFMYDRGYLDSDTSLASAVWCCFFDKENVDPRYIESLVSYIRHQLNHLNNFSHEKLEKQIKISGIWLSVKPHVDEIFKKV